jgi:hypothetical protein
MSKFVQVKANRLGLKDLALEHFAISGLDSLVHKYEECFSKNLFYLLIPRF